MVYNILFIRYNNNINTHKQLLMNMSINKHYFILKKFVKDGKQKSVSSVINKLKNTGPYYLKGHNDELFIDSVVWNNMIFSDKKRYFKTGNSFLDSDTNNKYYYIDVDIYFLPRNVTFRDKIRFYCKYHKNEIQRHSKNIIKSRKKITKGGSYKKINNRRNITNKIRKK